MFIGVQRIALQIPGARSLKDKRRVVRSFKEKLQSRLRVSVAEVADLDNLTSAIVAMAVVSNEASICDEVMSKAADMALVLAEAVMVDRATEVISLGRGGRGLRGGIEQLCTESGNSAICGRGREYDEHAD